MNRERAIAVLRNEMRLCEPFVKKKLYGEELTYKALDFAVKALEQQTSDDCVSRAEVLKGYIEIDRADGVEVYSDKAIPVEYVKALPPVTPTHGTCKDCAKSKTLNEYEGNNLVCSRFGRMAVNPDFYCADYEKRGNSDGSN